MKKTILSIFAMLLLVASISFAGTTSYPNFAGVDYDWRSEGRGTFATIGEDYNTYGVSLSDPKSIPLVADLDNNSVNEIIVIDDDSVKIYQNKELNFIDSLDLGNTITEMSNLIIYDIDGDGLQEIIFINSGISTTADALFIINFTQTDGLQLQNTFTLWDIFSKDVDYPQIACRKPNECFATITGRYGVNINDPVTYYFYGASFSSDNFTSSLITIYSESQTAGKGIALCPPRSQNMIVSDYDQDGTDEFIFTFGVMEKNDLYLRLYVNMYDNVTQEVQGFKEAYTPNPTGWESCSGENTIPNLITSPVSADLRTDKSNEEIYAGLQVDLQDDDFKIIIFDQTGDAYHEIPDIFEADGVIISNPVIANIFPETLTKDICIMGYDTEKDILDLVCGTESRGFLLGDDDEFKYNLDGQYNISIDVDNMDYLIHAVQHNNEEVEGVDLNEILTTYGIFYVDYENINELMRYWENPAGASMINSIDLEGIADDLLIMTSTNLLYLDDRLSNDKGIITSVNYNPCVLDNAIIQVNETLQIIVRGKDTNDAGLGFYDDMNFNIYIYEETNNEQVEQHRNISTSQSDGTTSIITTSFIANKTGSSHRILIEAWDSANPTEIDTYNQVFNVQNVGLKFGDVTCEDIVEIEEEELIGQVCVSDEDCGTASCIGGVCVAEEETLPVQAMREASSIFRIGVTALWLMFMMALAIAFWFAPVGKENNFFDSANARFGAIIIGEIFMLILGTMFGFLPIAIIITIIILGLIAFSIWLVKRFTGVGMGNG